MRSVVDGDGRDDGAPNGLADLTAFQRDILRYLARDDHSKGTAIRRGLEDYYGVDVNHGRLYPSLDQLVEKGFLAKSKRNRRTNDYALTDTARDTLTEYDAWADGDDETETDSEGDA